MNDFDPTNPLAAPAVDPAAPPPEGTSVEREAPDPSQSRRALVNEWNKQVLNAREHWTNRAFKQMVEDMRFAAGDQWSSAKALQLADGTLLDEPTSRYVANITLRHIQQRTASIYGKNPKVVARKKPRLLSTVWDGSQKSLMQAMQVLAQGLPDPNAMAVVQDASMVMAESQRLDKVAQTLQLMFEHEIDEQPVPFKVQMKSTVRRGLTTGVGFVKLGYQRVMELRPDIGGQIESLSQQLATLERLSADRADNEFTDDDLQMEQLRLLLAELSKQQGTVVREGVVFTYPDSTAIIPDVKTKQLRGFVGADWVAEEYYLTANQIKEIYHKDVSSAGNPAPDAQLPRSYEQTSAQGWAPVENTASDKTAPEYHCVWEIYSRADGLVYTVCDGYPEFLLEPTAPDIKLERFFPWFAFVVNEVYAPGAVYPPSDVTLIRDMQLELNRSRQGLREHRRASRPRTYTRKGVLEEADKDKIRNAEAHEIVELQGLGANEKITDVLQDHSGPPIDPRLYDPSPVYEDYLRSLGQHEANLGGTSGATATEASIAEASRGTNVSSVVDDLDEFLSELARATGQVILAECSAEKVKMVVGPGAVWPELSVDEIAREIYLDVEAASTGRPNKAQEIQNAQMLFPILMQIPGLDPEWLARELLRRLDDRLDITDAFASGMPSVQMLNHAQMAAGASPGAGPGGTSSDPTAQGGRGAANAPSTDPGQVNTAPRPPAPGVQPQVGPV